MQYAASTRPFDISKHVKKGVGGARERKYKKKGEGHLYTAFYFYFSAYNQLKIKSPTRYSREGRTQLACSKETQMSGDSSSTSKASLCEEKLARRNLLSWLPPRWHCVRNL